MDYLTDREEFILDGSPSGLPIKLVHYMKEYMRPMFWPKKTQGLSITI